MADTSCGSSTSATTACGHLTDTRHANYGVLNLDRTQGLTFNYIYDIPSLARFGSFFATPAGQQIFGGWQFSGLSSFSVGQPVTLTYTLTGIGQAELNRRITGSEDFAPRIVLTCNPSLPRNRRTILAYIDTSCVAPALKGSIHNDSGPDTVRGPGLNNWDMSLFKKFKYSENAQHFIQLRLEAYNVFNHTNWNTMNTVAQFNAITGQLVNAASPTNPAGFGALTAVRATGNTGSPRIIQVAAKFSF